MVMIGEPVVVAVLFTFVPALLFNDAILVGNTILLFDIDDDDDDVVDGGGIVFNIEEKFQMKSLNRDVTSRI